MKANEAPDRIYSIPTEGGFYLTAIKPEPPFTDGIEYTRTNVFIEKACKYLLYHLDTSKIDVNYKFEFIEDFRKYMKGE